MAALDIVRAGGRSLDRRLDRVSGEALLAGLRAAGAVSEPELAALGRPDGGGWARRLRALAAAKGDRTCRALLTVLEGLEGPPRPGPFDFYDPQRDSAPAHRSDCPCCWPRPPEEEEGAKTREEGPEEEEEEGEPKNEEENPEDEEGEPKNGDEGPEDDEDGGDEGPEDDDGGDEGPEDEDGGDEGPEDDDEGPRDEDEGPEDEDGGDEGPKDDDEGPRDEDEGPEDEGGGDEGPDDDEGGGGDED